MQPCSFPMRACSLLSRPVRAREFLVWCFLVLALVGFRARALGPSLEPDSYQYLSVAGNFATGKPGYTSIVHFDSERSHGTVPAPMTTFPAGYPAAIAALAAAGLAPEWSGTVLSAAAALSLLFLYWFLARALDVGGLGLRVAMLCTFANAELLIFARSVLSESLFTLLTVGAALLFAIGLAQRSRRAGGWGLFLAAGVLVGLAYWVRYAGLFLFAAMVLAAVLQLRRRERSARPVLFGLAVAAFIIGLGCVRNQLLVGTWKGGNEKAVHHPLLGVLGRAPVEIYHLLTGPIGSARYGLLDLLLVLALAGVAGLCIWRGRKAAPLAPPARTVLQVLGCYLVVYCAAMVYASHVSVISFGPRMFFPLLPLFLMLGAVAITRAQARLGSGRDGILVAALGVLVLAYVAVNVRSLASQPRTPAPDRSVQAALQEELASGMSVGAWIAANIPVGEVIVASHGQPTGYVLKRPTVSLVSRAYTDQTWGEPEVHALMLRYHARFLILYPGDEPELYDSPFLAGLVAGAPSSWLAPVALARDIKIFRI